MLLQFAINFDSKLAALLTTVTLGKNFAALNRGRHLYSAGQPSRLALAHILVIAALRSRCRHYIFALWFLLSIYLLLFFIA